MSFQVTVTGHSSEPHNAEVKAVGVEAVKKLRLLGIDAHLSGYSQDETGAIQLVDADVDDDAAGTAE